MNNRTISTTKSLLPALALSLVLASCERLVFDREVATSDPRANFDYLWSEVDAKYSYFGLKGIDWDSARGAYAARLRDDMAERELFDLLAGMLLELRDDHTNLMSPFDVASYNLYLQSPGNYLARVVRTRYLGDGARRTGPFLHGWADTARRVAYVRYSSFTDMFGDNHLEHILRLYAQADGMVLDLRENGGGAIFNVPALLGRFAERETLAGYFITRSGPGHGDFGPREPFHIVPSAGRTFLRPLMVLVDRGSYSATTMFALATKALPNVTLVGQPTGGGGGLPNGGQLPNGWTYRFSITQNLDLAGDNYAEAGVPPDIEASFDWSDLSRDEILDRAIAEIAALAGR